MKKIWSLFSGSLQFYQQQKKFGYKYFCIKPLEYKNETISSTYIKFLISKGNIEKANKLLDKDFSLSSTVIHGQNFGTKLGFPTANLRYPENIIKLPYGVYAVETEGYPAVMNWGKKPTVSSDNTEIMEVHIPNFNKNLYDKTLNIKILKKIRDEKKFSSFDELKSQIAKDIEECLKL